jgi:hypothetical protein
MPELPNSVKRRSFSASEKNAVKIMSGGKSEGKQIKSWLTRWMGRESLIKPKAIVKPTINANVAVPIDCMRELKKASAKLELVVRVKLGSISRASTSNHTKKR